MKGRYKLATVIVLASVLETSPMTFAKDYSSYTPEQIESEIAQLESELQELYDIRDSLSADSETEDTDDSGENDHAKVLAYSGSGDDVVTLDDYDDWHMFVINGNSSGKYFGVTAYDEDGERLSSLVNTTDVYHGIVYDDTQSAKMLEVKAEGDWSITVVSLYAADYGVKGDTVTGSGDDVVVFYPDAGDSTTAYISGNDGAKYFGVIAYDGYGSRIGSLVNTVDPYDGYGSRIGSLVNTVDPYDGTVMLKEEPRIFVIKATGDWSIKFE